LKGFDIVAIKLVNTKLFSCLHICFIGVIADL